MSLKIKTFPITENAFLDFQSVTVSFFCFYYLLSGTTE